MKVELELPDYSDERKIWVIAGNEPVACRYRFVDKDGNVTYRWFRKVSRCSLCGKCCMNLRPEHPFVKEDGICQFLKQVDPDKYECHAPFGMPWGCLTGQGKPAGWILESRCGAKIIPECTVEYEEI